ncbi:valyl-tRNA synthetase [Jatrophihabitans endophyticus]|uniref:Valine--tRNA ligase n=1 Tax=Jatrophihabitans endophyticus TaxID=1206085 RepID=A0A1M5UP24_9ACTN|nr:valine--tRNA ligase [Jatrophihabitans endophyticus]SHH64822.1 valyl-tRNA synthetase [Jatrophihabitans endophyticus]
MTDEPTPTPSLPSQFRPAEVEGPLYERWVERGYFTADPSSDKPRWSLVIPPPNVTGNLHIGHALEQSMMDALSRRARMRGHDTLWLPGMDHASIAVNNLVERHLAETEGRSRSDYTREEFLDKAWEWKNRYGGQILGQMRRLGDGVDWSRERFTMDDGLSAAVQTIFKRLYDDDLIYRAERIINWCPRDMTALSDAEVDHADEPGELVSIRYGDGDDAIVVATTRAETMLGDTAVAVHPDDERYRHLVGTEVALPLTNRRIPIVADPHVDPSFGTGAVKVTPAHDPNDFEIGRRHELPMPTIMDERAVITAPGPFAGLDRMEARYAIVAALREEGRIVAEKRPYEHAVGHCSRCDTVVEPRLSLQWWVRVETLARAAADAVRDGRVQIEPASMRSRYFQWVDGLRDWCISRQLWWGHRIPVWYSPDGDDVCVGPGEEPPAGWTQDDDVLDTWFSSALWPFSTLGWPDDTEDLRAYYPTTVLVTGYDILFFWVVRMMLFGLYAMDGEVPFRTVLLHGLVRDASGKKMSKSRGNVVDPLVWIDEYGADAVRLSLLQGANPGADQAINEEWVVGARNFGTKLWNATRFALMSGATVEGDVPRDDTLTSADRWVLGRLDAVLAEVDALYERFELAKIADTLYHFAWDEVCDWYIELAKLSLAGPAPATTRRVLGEVLDAVLRLLHPMTPFITEALWTTLTAGESLVVADWPVAGGWPALDDAADEVRVVQTVVTYVRRFRSDQGIKPSLRVPSRLRHVAESAEASIRALARLDDPGADFTATATLEAGFGVIVQLDLSGAIDVTAERARLTKERGTAEQEFAANSKKLANDAFVAKAAPAAVAKVRDRLAAAEAELARIDAALAVLPTA